MSQTRSIGTEYCAKCGKPYTTLNQTIKRTIKRFGEYVCPDCAKELSKEKRKKACIDKYGVDNPMKVKSIQEKLKKIHEEKYGFSTPFLNPEIQEKIHKEYFEKTGYLNPAQNPECKEKAKQTNLERYGCEYPLQNEEIREKAIHTVYENDTIPTSRPQIECYNLFKTMGYDVFLNYPEGKLSLDVLIKIDEVLIDFEYDGWYWHQDKQKDCARNAVLMDLGYKIFRIKAYSDIIPSSDILQNGIDELLNTDKQIYYIEMN